MKSSWIYNFIHHTCWNIFGTFTWFSAVAKKVTWDRRQTKLTLPNTLTLFLFKNNDPLEKFFAPLIAQQTPILLASDDVSNCCYGGSSLREASSSRRQGRARRQRARSRPVCRSPSSKWRAVLGRQHRRLPVLSSPLLRDLTWPVFAEKRKLEVERGGACAALRHSTAQLLWRRQRREGRRCRRRRRIFKRINIRLIMLYITGYWDYILLSENNFWEWSTILLLANVSDLPQALRPSSASSEDLC
jgi:hypothetical protein